MERTGSILKSMTPPSREAAAAAKRRWDSIAKPLGSLGVLEDIVTRIAGISRTADVDVSRRAVIVMCADNGVVAEGVTQTGQEVTAIVTENLAKGDTSVCRMARAANADVIPVDIGVMRPVDIPASGQKNIRRGTDNMTRGPAMTRDEALKAVMTGMDMVKYAKDEGYNIIATGEMGIGNTTTSSAVTAVLTGRDAAEVTGRGAGLSSEGLARKINAIERAIALNKPERSDALDVLGKVGGLDIAGLAGICIGGGVYGMPVILDGFISLASALVAERLCPECGEFLIASHISNEPATHILIEEMGLTPVICAGMHLGEGTGAVALLPLIDLALAVYNGMRTFEDISVEAYKPLC